MQQEHHGNDILQPYNGFKVITSLLGSIWNLLFLILMIIKVYCNKRETKINSPVILLLCGFFAAGSFTLLINGIGVGLYDNWYDVSPNSPSFFLLCTYELGMTMTLLFGYTFYAAQLYYTFENSAMNISKGIKYLHGIIITIILLITIGIIILFFIVGDREYYIGRSLILIVFTLVVLATVHLILLLNKRLFALILTQRQAVYHIAMRKRTKELQRQGYTTNTCKDITIRNPKMQQMESVASTSHTRNSTKSVTLAKMESVTLDVVDDNTPTNTTTNFHRQDTEDLELERKEIEMNERQLMLIKVITKLSALFGIFVPDALIIVIIGLLAFTMKTDIMDFVFWSVFTVGHMIGSLCFFLTLSLNESWFNVICGRCNKLCVNICSGLAKKSMRRREEYGEDFEIDYWE